MKVILIIILVYFVLMLFGRYVLPMVLKGYVRHYSKKFYDEMEQTKSDRTRQEGEVKISKNKSEKSPKHHVDGEYVDYEEIK